MEGGPARPGLPGAQRCQDGAGQRIPTINPEQGREPTLLVAVSAFADGSAQQPPKRHCRNGFSSPLTACLRTRLLCTDSRVSCLTVPRLPFRSSWRWRQADETARQRDLAASKSSDCVQPPSICLADSPQSVDWSVSWAVCRHQFDYKYKINLAPSIHRRPSQIDPSEPCQRVLGRRQVRLWSVETQEWPRARTRAGCASSSRCRRLARTVPNLIPAGSDRAVCPDSACRHGCCP